MEAFPNKVFPSNRQAKEGSNFFPDFSGFYGFVGKVHGCLIVLMGNLVGI